MKLKLELADGDNEYINNPFVDGDNEYINNPLPQILWDKITFPILHHVSKGNCDGSALIRNDIRHFVEYPMSNVYDHIIMMLNDQMESEVL